MTESDIPDDFPREPFPAALAGAQPKLAGRMVVEGRFVVGLTPQERAERYVMCQNLVVQLLHYCGKKAVEHPRWSADTLLARVEKGIRNKQAEWDLGGSEVDWIVTRVRATLSNSICRRAGSRLAVPSTEASLPGLACQRTGLKVLRSSAPVSPARSLGT